MAASSQVCTPHGPPGHVAWAGPGIGSSSLQGFPPRLLAISQCCPPAMTQRDNWSLSELSLVRQVGAGAASCVYYALCRRTHMPLAVKIYEKAKLSVLNRHQVDREVNIHSSLSHPHILDFYAAFEDDQRIYLLLEFAAGGDLFDEVKRRGGRLSEREVVAGVLTPYLDALAYLHARGVVHRDIKPENTVFTREGVLKVADFGLAVNQAMERPVTRLGTLDYMAPEVLRCPDKQMPADNKGRADLAYGPAVDVWALGVLAYELLIGRPPFGMSCRDDTMRAICQASPPIPDWLSPAAASFIVSALQANASQRPSVVSLRQHPWITGAMSLGVVPGPHLAGVMPAVSMPLSARAASAHLHPVQMPGSCVPTTFVHTVASAAGMQAQPQLPRAAVAALSVTDGSCAALPGVWNGSAAALPVQPPVFRCLSGITVAHPAAWSQAPSTPITSSSHQQLHQQQGVVSGSGITVGPAGAGVWQQVSPTRAAAHLQPQMQRQGSAAILPVVLHAPPTMGVRSASISLDDLLDPQFSQLMQQHAAASAARPPTAQALSRAQLASSLSRSSASLGSNSGPQQMYALSQTVPTGLTQCGGGAGSKQALGIPPLATPRGGAAAGGSASGPALMMYAGSGASSGAAAQMAYLSHHQSPVAAQPAPWLYDSTGDMHSSGRPSACQSTPPNSATREQQQQSARAVMQQLQPAGSATSQQLQQWGTDVVFSSGGSTPNLAHVLLGRSNPNLSLAMEMQHEERPAKRVQPLQRSQSVHLANMQQPSAVLQAAVNAQSNTSQLTTINSAAHDASLENPNPQLVTVMPLLPAAPMLPVAPPARYCTSAAAPQWPLQPRALFSTPPPSVAHTLSAHLQHFNQPPKQAYQPHVLHHVSSNQHVYAGMGHVHGHVPRAAAMNYWRTDGMGWGSGPDPLAQLARQQSNCQGTSQPAGMQGGQQQSVIQGSNAGLQSFPILQAGGNPKPLQQQLQQYQEQQGQQQYVQQQGQQQYVQQQGQQQYVEQQQQQANAEMQADIGTLQQQQHQQHGSGAMQAAATLLLGQGNCGFQSSAQPPGSMMQVVENQQAQQQSRVRSQGVVRCLTPRDLFFSKQQAFLLGPTETTQLETGAVPSPQLPGAHSGGSFTDVLSNSRPASARSFVSVKRRTPDVSHDDVVGTLRRYGSLNVGAPSTGLTDAFTTGFSQALEQLAAATAGSDGTPGSAGSLDPSSGLSIAGYAHLSSSTGTTPRAAGGAASIGQHTPSLSRFHVSTPASGCLGAAAAAARSAASVRTHGSGLQGAQVMQLQPMLQDVALLAAAISAPAQQQQTPQPGVVMLINDGRQMAVPYSPNQTSAMQEQQLRQDQAWSNSLTDATSAAQVSAGSMATSQAAPQALVSAPSHPPLLPSRAVDRPTLSAPQPGTSTGQHLLQAGSISGRERHGISFASRSRMSPLVPGSQDGPTSGPVSGTAGMQPAQSAGIESGETGRGASRTPPLPGRGNSASNLSSLPLTQEVLRLRAGHFRSLSGVPLDSGSRQTTCSLDLQHLLDEGGFVEPPMFTMGLLGPGSKSCSGHEMLAGHGRRGQQADRMSGRSHLHRHLQLSSSTNSSLVTAAQGLGFNNTGGSGASQNQTTGMAGAGFIAAEPAGAGAPFLQPDSHSSQEVVMSEAGSETERAGVAIPQQHAHELHPARMECSEGGAAASVVQAPHAAAASSQQEGLSFVLWQLQDRQHSGAQGSHTQAVVDGKPVMPHESASNGAYAQWQQQCNVVAHDLLTTDTSSIDGTIRVEAGVGGTPATGVHLQPQHMPPHPTLAPAPSFELPHLSMLMLNPPSSRTTSGSLDRVLEQVLEHEDGNASSDQAQPNSKGWAVS